MPEDYGRSMTIKEMNGQAQETANVLSEVVHRTMPDENAANVQGEQKAIEAPDLERRVERLESFVEAIANHFPFAPLQKL